MHVGFWWRNHKEGDCLDDLDLKEWKILMWILKSYRVMQEE
jgi:hypothetical protein